jgi:hypothetical protein
MDTSSEHQRQDVPQPFITDAYMAALEDQSGDQSDLSEDQRKALRQIFITEEYKALRDEILKRVDIRYQLVNFTLITAAALFSAGLQPSVTPSVLLVYPLLSMFLAAGWIQNNRTMYEAAKYIRNNIERQHGSPGWQTALASLAASRKTTLITFLGSLFFFSLSVFCGTQITATLLGIARMEDSAPKPEEWILLVLDCIAVLLTFVMLVKEKRFRSEFKMV